MIIKQQKEELRKLKINLQIQDEKIEKTKKTIENATRKVKELESMFDSNTLQCNANVLFLIGQSQLKSILNDDHILRRMISKTKDEFDDICARVGKESKKDTLLFYKDGNPLQENRCQLSRDQIVYVTILSKKSPQRQIDIEYCFGIHPNTVSSNITYLDDILEKVLPTPDIIAGEIRNANKKTTLGNFVPNNVIITDGTENQIERPQDNETQKKYYSGKKKRYTVKTTIMVNEKGLIIYLGPQHKDKMNNMDMLKTDNPQLGLVTLSMKSPDTLESNKIDHYSDLEYLGVHKTYPGARQCQPTLQKGELTKAQRKEKNQIRIQVEHAIGKLKQYAVLRNTYIGSEQKFYQDMQIMAGLVNHHVLWDCNERKVKYGL